MLVAARTDSTLLCVILEYKAIMFISTNRVAKILTGPHISGYLKNKSPAILSLSRVLTDSAGTTVKF